MIYPDDFICPACGSHDLEDESPDWECRACGWFGGRDELKRQADE